LINRIEQGFNRKWNKILEGDDYREKARLEFERGNFEEAYNYNREAERCYFETPVTPVKRLFYVQHDILRCLEELIEKGRLDFYEIYKERAKRFFEEWSEDKIKTIFGREDKIKEALSFRAWRKSFFDGFYDFRVAESAIKVGDFEKARQVYDELIKKIEKSEDLESDALLAITKSKRAMLLNVLQEFSKPEGFRNLNVIVEGYKEAAEACQLPENTKSQQIKRIEAFRNIYLSNAFKFEAFKCLQDEEIARNPEGKLIEAKGRFEKALLHAYTSINLDQSVCSHFHIEYLTYWLNIVCERIHILRFMSKGEENEYNLALKHLRAAVRSARKIVEKYGEESIFPNRYYSIEDLEVEELFLKAAHAFRFRKWKRSVVLLTECLTKFPTKYYLSWRHIQIFIRLLVAKAICALEENDYPSFYDACRKLVEIKNSEPIGKTGRFLCNWVDSVQYIFMKELQDGKSIIFDEEKISKLWEYFPLDAYLQDDLYIEDMKYSDPFLSLPPDIYYRIKETGRPSNEKDVEVCKVRLLSAIEAFLGYLYDYYFQLFHKKERPDLNKAIQEDTPQILLRKIFELIDTNWKNPEFINSLTGLENALEELLKSKDPQMYLKAYEKIYGSLYGLLKFFPTIIKVNSLTPTEGFISFEKFPSWYLTEIQATIEKKYKTFESRAEWLVSEYRPGREKIFIHIPADESIEVAKYYLPREWRKGNRIFYPVSERLPLLKVFFEPRWGYWDSKRDAISLKSMKENTVIILGSYRFKDELNKVRDYLFKNYNYVTLVETLPEVPFIGPYAKSTFWMEQGRFCILIDRGPSGHLNEYEHAKRFPEKVILAYLYPRDSGYATTLVEDAIICELKNIRFFEFVEEELFKKINEAVDWAEGVIKRRETIKKQLELKKKK
jgi:hypothetical protein